MSTHALDLLDCDAFDRVHDKHALEKVQRIGRNMLGQQIFPAHNLLEEARHVCVVERQLQVQNKHTKRPRVSGVEWSGVEWSGVEWSRE